MHFEKTSKYFDNCTSAEKQLKRHLKDYEKSKKYYTKQDNDINLKLRPNLSTAIKNAVFLGSFNEENPKSAMCEMELFYNAKEFDNHFEN